MVMRLLRKEYGGRQVGREGQSLVLNVLNRWPAFLRRMVGHRDSELLRGLPNRADNPLHPITKNSFGFLKESLTSSAKDLACGM